MDISGAEAAPSPIEQTDTSDNEIIFNFKCIDNSLFETSLVKDVVVVGENLVMIGDLGLESEVQRDSDNDSSSEGFEGVYTPEVARVDSKIQKPSDSEVMLEAVKTYFASFGSILKESVECKLAESHKNLDSRLTESHKNLDSRLTESHSILAQSNKDLEENLECKLAESHKNLNSRLKESHNKFLESQKTLESLETKITKNFSLLTLNQNSLENKFMDNFKNIALSQASMTEELEDVKSNLSETRTLITSQGFDLQATMEKMSVDCKERADRLEEEVFINRDSLGRLEEQILIQGDNLEELRNEVDKVRLEKACESAELEDSLMRKLMLEMDKVRKVQTVSRPIPQFADTMPKTVVLRDYPSDGSSDSAESQECMNVGTRSRVKNIRLREPMFVSDSYQSAPDFLQQVEVYFNNVGIFTDHERLTAFPEFLRGNPARWCRIQLSEVTSWAQLCDKFLRQYYNRNEIGQEWENLSLNRFKGDCEAFVIRAWQLQSNLNEGFDDQKKCANIIRKLPGYLQDRVKDRYHSDFNEFLANVKEISKTNQREYTSWKNNRGGYFANSGSNTYTNDASKQAEVDTVRPNQDKDNYNNYRNNNNRKFRKTYRNNNNSNSRKFNNSNTAPYNSNYKGRNYIQNYNNKRGSPPRKDQKKGKGPNTTPSNLNNITLVPITGLPGAFTITGPGVNNLSPTPLSPVAPLQIVGSNPPNATSNNSGVPN